MANVVHNGVQRIDDYTVWADGSAVDHCWNGYPVSVVNTWCEDREGTIDHWQNGLPCSAAGKIVTTDDPPARLQNGFGFSAANRLCVNYTADPNDWTMRGGFMFDVDGALKLASS